MSESSSVQGRETARHFRRLYLIALSLIAALAIGGQVLIQRSLGTQLADGHVVNQAGYQRMLSQRITLKLMLHDPAAADATAQRAAITALRDRWVAAHQALSASVGRVAYGPGARATLTGLFLEAEQPLQRIATLVTKLTDSGPLTPAERSALMADQELFLPLMDAVVLAFEHSLQARVTFLRRVELTLLLITLAVLALEALFIFRPAVRRLRTSLEQLETRHHQSARRLESLRHLAGGIAHSFNNLLTGIMGHADLERSDALRTGRNTEYIDAQLKGCKRAAEIITHLVTYSGHGKYDLAPTLLGPWLADLVRFFPPANPAVQVRLEAEETIEAEIDRSALRQAIEGILTNAVEAMLPQPGTVILRLTQVMLSEPLSLAGPYRTELPAGLYARIQVIDEGHGIAPEDLERIFHPYFTSKEFGRGLGLAAVLGIAHGHGGGIHVAPNAARGSVVSLYVPLSGATETPRASVPRHTAKPA